MDFSRPNGMNAFCVYQDQIIMMRDYDLWAEDEELLLGDDKLQQLIEGSQAIQEIREEERKKKEEVKE